MRKVMRVGTVKIWKGGRWASVFVLAEFNNGRLSITGVIGPTSGGNALGGCGQIDGGFAHRDPKDNDARTANPTKPSEIRFAPGWTAERWLDLLDIWGRWHLNDMKAGCEHQRAEGWDKRPIDPSKPTTAYGKFFPGQKLDGWNLLSWISPEEHPDGLLTKPCPNCGYKYGTAWKREKVPAAVIAQIEALPNADQQPAWI